MKKVSLGILFLAVIMSLCIGGVGGFFVGVATTDLGKAMVQGMLSTERQADTSNPKKLSRTSFELQYPSNWKIDTASDTYDPDASFTISSPGLTTVVFNIIPGQTDQEEFFKGQIDLEKKLLRRPVVTPLHKFGSFKCKGVMLRGRMIGVPTTVKVILFSRGDLTVISRQECSDEDLRLAQDGLTLIENSFKLKSAPSPG